MSKYCGKVCTRAVKSQKARELRAKYRVLCFNCKSKKVKLDSKVNFVSQFTVA